MVLKVLWSVVTVAGWLSIGVQTVRIMWPASPWLAVAAMFADTTVIVHMLGHQWELG